MIDRFPLPVLAEGPSSASGEAPRAWRSLEEREAYEAFDAARASEFPKGYFQPTRRDVFKLLGGAAALTGLSGCFQRPSEKVMEFARAPVDGIPGRPLHYATAHSLWGLGRGLLATNWAGHPQKVDGNPLHPTMEGGSSVWEQALPFGLYDPGRATQVLKHGEPVGYAAFVEAQRERAKALEKDGGSRLRFLFGPDSSPLIASMRAQLLARFPKAKLVTYQAASRQNVYAGAALAFGRAVEPLPTFEGTRCIVSLDADFLVRSPDAPIAARRFAKTRDPAAAMSRLYVVEPALTVTGMTADHRLALGSHDLRRFARALLGEVASKRGGALAAFTDPKAGEGLSEHARKWLHAAADDLVKAGGGALVLAGPREPPEVHAIAHAINHALGTTGIEYREPSLHELQDGPEALAALVSECGGGGVDTLVITAFDPVYTAPGDVDLGAALGKVPNVVYRAERMDATAARAGWVVNAAHVLESWGDLRAPDGTASLVQPLVAPLWQGATEAELLLPFLERKERTAHALLQAQWNAQAEGRWEDWLADGVVPGTQAPRVTPAFDPAKLKAALGPLPPRPEGMELAFDTDYSVFDGRYDRNAWLQELPDPVTKLTWDNAAILSPTTAARLGVKSQQLVRIAAGMHAVELPVFILPGCADEVVSLALGYGRAGPGGEPAVGVDVSPLRTGSGFWFRGGANVTPLLTERPLATTQDHWSLDARSIAIARTLDELRQEGDHLLEEHRGPLETLYEPPKGGDYRWAMEVDLQRCIGCSACVMACASENNVPVVGREQVRAGREMFWLRIDRYFEGPADDPDVVTQPMLCQHCEMAPCEYVCPVNATVHSDEGLNEMVYNRCVGTRFCSNNCPYKVRRFNWLDFHQDWPELRAMSQNPQVTIREQGVMEKCTYCVQRIEQARIDARIAGERIDTGALQTACQQACPTRAIAFGSLTDETGEVTRQRKDARHYVVLHDRGTRPRTGYLARIRNPNPEL